MEAGRTMSTLKSKSRKRGLSSNVSNLIEARAPSEPLMVLPLSLPKDRPKIPKTDYFYSKNAVCSPKRLGQSMRHEPGANATSSLVAGKDVEAVIKTLQQELQTATARCENLEDLLSSRSATIARLRKEKAELADELALYKARYHVPIPSAKGYQKPRSWTGESSRQGRLQGKHKADMKNTAPPVGSEAPRTACEPNPLGITTKTSLLTSNKINTSLSRHFSGECAATKQDGEIAQSQLKTYSTFGRETKVQRPLNDHAVTSDNRGGQDCDASPVLSSRLLRCLDYALQYDRQNALKDRVSFYPETLANEQANCDVTSADRLEQLHLTGTERVLASIVGCERVYVWIFDSEANELKRRYMSPPQLHDLTGRPVLSGSGAEESRLEDWKQSIQSTCIKLDSSASESLVKQAALRGYPISSRLFPAWRDYFNWEVDGLGGRAVTSIAKRKSDFQVEDFLCVPICRPEIPSSGRVRKETLSPVDLHRKPGELEGVIIALANAAPVADFGTVCGRMLSPTSDHALSTSRSQLLPDCDTFLLLAGAILLPRMRRHHSKTKLTTYVNNLASISHCIPQFLSHLASTSFTWTIDTLVSQLERRLREIFYGRELKLLLADSANGRFWSLSNTSVPIGLGFLRQYQEKGSGMAAHALKTRMPMVLNAEEVKELPSYDPTVDISPGPCGVWLLPIFDRDNVVQAVLQIQRICIPNPSLLREREDLERVLLPRLAEQVGFLLNAFLETKTIICDSDNSKVVVQHWEGQIQAEVERQLAIKLHTYKWEGSAQPAKGSLSKQQLSKENEKIPRFLSDSEAAVTIQSHFRGYRTRKGFVKLKVEPAASQYAESLSLGDAATRIQSKFRGYCARKKFGNRAYKPCSAEDLSKRSSLVMSSETALAPAPCLVTPTCLLTAAHPRDEVQVLVHPLSPALVRLHHNTERASSPLPVDRIPTMGPMAVYARPGSSPSHGTLAQVNLEVSEMKKARGNGQRLVHRHAGDNDTLNDAAVIIQAHARGYLVRRSLENYDSPHCPVPSPFPGSTNGRGSYPFIASSDLTNPDEDSAGTAETSCDTGSAGCVSVYERSCQGSFHPMLPSNIDSPLLDAAAIKIQAQFRGHTVRKHYQPRSERFPIRVPLHTGDKFEGPKAGPHVVLTQRPATTCLPPTYGYQRVIAAPQPLTSRGSPSHVYGAHYKSGMPHEPRVTSAGISWEQSREFSLIQSLPPHEAAVKIQAAFKGMQVRRKMPQAHHPTHRPPPPSTPPPPRKITHNSSSSSQIAVGRAIHQQPYSAGITRLGCPYMTDVSIPVFKGPPPCQNLQEDVVVLDSKLTDIPHE